MPTAYDPATARAAEIGVPELCRVSEDPSVPGGLTVGYDCHDGQWRALESRRRFVAVLAGTQGGKTSWGPLWLHREIYGDSEQPGRGGGDYLAVTASYDLFKLKMLPAMREVFEGIYGSGRYWAGDRLFELSDPATGRFWARRADDPMWGRIILRSAEAGSGLESSTAKGAWLDEAGQDSFRAETWRAVLSRLSLHMGRALLSTTIYNFGWLKTEVYDRWKAGDPDYDVIQFDSILNPRFPREEWDRARRTLPRWRFDMRYRGVFTRPAGQIYDSYADEPYPAGRLVEDFPVPSTWPRHLGLDFGGAHTAGVGLAEDPNTGFLYAYREYLEGGRTAAGHAEALLAPEPRPFASAYGGSPSEQQWRDEFSEAGLPVLRPAVAEVEVGIDRVYGLFQQGRLFVFRGCAGLRRELVAYSRKLGKDEEPTEEIEHKSRYHRLDALRYVGASLADGPGGAGAVVAAPDPRAGYRGSGRGGRRGRDARRGDY